MSTWRVIGGAPGGISPGAPSIFVNVVTLGAVADSADGAPGTNNTAILKAALTALGASGGGVLWFPAATLMYGTLDLDVPSGVSIQGAGYQSKIMRWGNLSAANRGIFNFTSVSDSSIKNILIDGDVTTAQGLLYSAFSGDPMNATLTQNTSVWINGGCTDIIIQDVCIQHTGGYTIMLDARTGNIVRPKIVGCDFLNNRPFLFGTSSGDLNYGSWPGGIHYQMDGISANTNVQQLTVSGCYFNACTGNQVWGGAYSVTNGYHQQIKVDRNTFEDIGLDAILFGQVLGGSAIGNTFRRIGYIVTADGGSSTPKWLANLYAVAIDSSGVVKGVVVEGNDGISINGLCMSGDGFCHGTYNGNTFRIPVSGEPEYTTDSVSLMGPGGAGANWMQGLVFDNSANQEGGDSCTISSNHFYNFGGCNLGGYASRNSHWVGNYCYPPVAPNQAPIAFGNIGTGANQRAYSNTMVQTYANWSPASASPLIIEDATGGAFSSTDQNLISGTMIFGGGNAFEFLRNSVTLSAVRSSYGTNSSSVTAIDQHYVQEEGNSAAFTTAMKWYFQNASGATQHMQLQAFWNASGSLGPLLNVSAAGVGGLLATGARTTSLVNDGLVTGMVYGDDFFALTDTTYSNTNANLLNQVVGGGSTGVAVTMLLRYHGSVGYPEVSTSINSGARVWQALTSIAPGSDEDLVYNKSGVLAGDGNLIWDYTDQILKITGGATTFGEQIVLNTASTGQQAAIVLESAGTAKWQVGMGTTNYYFLYDSVGGYDAIHVVPNGNLFLLAAASTNVLIANSTDDGSGARLQITGFVSATSGYYSAGTSYQTVKIPSGGLYGKSINLTQYLAMSSMATGSLAPTSGDNWGTIPPPGVFHFDQTSGTAFWRASYGTGASTIADAFLWGSGLYASAASYQAVQAPSGNFYGVGANLTGYIAMASSSPSPTSGDTWASGPGVMYYSSTGTSWQFSYGNGASTLTPAYVSALGFNASGTATNAIQASSGGVTALWLLATDSLFFIDEARPALSASGQSRIYMDNGSGSFAVGLYASINGAAYQQLTFGGVSGSGTSGDVAYWNGSSSISASSKFTWNNSSQLLTVTAVNSSSAGIACGTGYIQADAGFLATTGTATSYQAIQAPGGGLYGLSTRSAHYTTIGQSNGGPGTGGGAASITSGDALQLGLIYWDTGSGYAKICTSTGGSGTFSPLYLTNGTGISLSGNQIVNSGVTSLQGSTGAVTLVQGTGVTISGLTISIGQAVATSSGVTFNTVSVSSSATNAINCTGGIDCAAIFASDNLTNSLSTNGGIQAQAGGSTTNNILIAGSKVIVDNNGVFASSAGVAVGAANIGAQAFGWWTGSSYSVAPNTTQNYTTITQIIVSGGIVTFLSGSSDARLKTVTGVFPHGMDAIKELHPVTYRWKEKAELMGFRNNARDMIGFLAQDVERAMGRCPSATHEDDLGYLSYEKDALVAALVIAAQEVDMRLKKLEVRN